MKRYGLFLLPVLLLVASFTGVGGNGGAILSFEKDGLDYGQLYTDSLPDGEETIYFTNTGDEPLVISNTRACCGTKVTHYPRQPIMPGARDSINIQFNLAPRPQRISRVVTITSNCSHNFSHTWRINGRVTER